MALAAQAAVPCGARVAQQTCAPCGESLCMLAEEGLQVFDHHSLRRTVGQHDHDVQGQHLLSPGNDADDKCAAATDSMEVDHGDAQQCKR